MILYTGTTRDPDGTERRVFVDDPANLPPALDAYRSYVFEDDAHPWETTILPVIRQQEKVGVRVTWHVGRRYYDSDLMGRMTPEMRRVIEQSGTPPCSFCGFLLGLHAIACPWHDAKGCVSCGEGAR